MLWTNLGAFFSNSYAAMCAGLTTCSGRSPCGTLTTFSWSEVASRLGTWVEVISIGGHDAKIAMSLV